MLYRDTIYLVISILFPNHLTRHIFKVVHLHLPLKFCTMYIYFVFYLHTLFAKPFLKLSSISNPIFNNITNEFPWCVYTNSRFDKYTVLILEEFYIKTIHVSNHSLKIYSYCHRG